MNIYTWFETSFPYLFIIQELFCLTEMHNCFTYCTIMQTYSLSVLINHIPTSGEQIRNEIWRPTYQVCHSICNASMSAEIEYHEKPQRLQNLHKTCYQLQSKADRAPSCPPSLSHGQRGGTQMATKCLPGMRSTSSTSPLPLLCHKPETLLERVLQYTVYCKQAKLLT